MSLPAWVEEHWGSYDHEICGDECPLRQALSIAWEALEDISTMEENPRVQPPERDLGHMIKAASIVCAEAMRRIEEMGK